jgi:PKD repeat protein
MKRTLYIGILVAFLSLLVISGSVLAEENTTPTTEPTTVPTTTVPPTPAPPVADFSSDVTSGSAPLTVEFFEESTGVLSSGSWDFGDGSPLARVPNPVHTYTEPGIYDVTHTVSNPGGEDSITKFGYITVSESGEELEADFTASPRSGAAPLTVDFTDTSSGDPTSWEWDFGDYVTSDDQNPTHTYQTEGTYTVTLTVENAGDSDEVIKEDYIEVSGSDDELEADFTASPRSGSAPLSVEFTDTSDGDPTSWEWDFGDYVVSDEQDPIHTYQTEGTYTVTLTVENSQGSNTTIKEDYITVGESGGELEADFTASPRSGLPPRAVQFTDLSEGSPDSWEWDFGDGVTLDIYQNPVHVYTATGTYTVSLTISKSGETDIEVKTAYITIGNAPATTTTAPTSTPDEDDGALTSSSQPQDSSSETNPIMREIHKVSGVFGELLSYLLELIGL